MIIDAHAHAFPFLGNKGIFDSEAEHTRYLQRHMTTHPQGGRRFRDNGLRRWPDALGRQDTGLCRPARRQFPPRSLWPLRVGKGWRGLLHPILPGVARGHGVKARAHVGADAVRRCRQGNAAICQDVQSHQTSIIPTACAVGRTSFAPAPRSTRMRPTTNRRSTGCAAP